MPTATVTSKGQVTIPAEVRLQLGIETGDRIDFIDIGQGQFAIVAATRSVKELKGIFRGRRKKPVSIEQMNQAIARHLSKSP